MTRNSLDKMTIPLINECNRLVHIFHWDDREDRSKDLPKQSNSISALQYTANK